MPRDEKSYAQVMREYDEEKRFLRKMRHRVFHPNYESPILFRLTGYLVRFVILAIVVAVVLFMRNRKYFNGDRFSQEVQTEFDHFMDGTESRLLKVNWKHDKLLTSYSAKGGPNAFFSEINLQRITARGKWRDLLLNNGWNLNEIEIGDATVKLKAGLSIAPDQASKDRVRPSSWFNATPDFEQTRFDDITLHNADFQWGPNWRSVGSLNDCSGTLQRKLGQWSLSLRNATFTQNWLRNLTLDKNQPIDIAVEEDKIVISHGEFELGETGRATINGTIQLGETPEIDLKISMKTVNLTDILPAEFHTAVAGLADFEMRLTGSPNRSDGMIFEGEMTMVESGRLREIAILTTLSVVTPRSEMRLMPIRSRSTIKFKTRQGLLTVSDIDIRGGGTSVASAGYKNEQGEFLEFARIVGGFTYQMDTSELDKSLILNSIKTAIEEDVMEDVGPLIGFNGEVRVGMPWPLLGKEEGFREKHFTPDEEGYGWIKLPLKGALDEITKVESSAMDIEWTEISKRARRVQ